MRITKIHEVKTISGAAGGASVKAVVNIQVTGESDTVEQVRAFLAAAPDMAEALSSVLETAVYLGATEKHPAVMAARAALAKAGR